MHIGKAFKMVREATGISLAGLSDISCVHRTHIHNIEAGRKCPSWNTFLNLCEGLDVPASVIVLVSEVDDNLALSAVLIIAQHLGRKERTWSTSHYTSTPMQALMGQVQSLVSSNERVR